MKHKGTQKKKKLRAYGATLFCLILFIIRLTSLCHDALLKYTWDKIIQDVIWTGIFGIASFFSFYDAKKIGTSKAINDEDDERDKFIEMKTGKTMFTISQYLIFSLGAIALIGALILYNRGTSNDFGSMILMSIAVTLLVIWNLLILIWLIITFINYRRD